MNDFTIKVHGLTNANKDEFEEAFELFLMQHPFMRDEKGEIYMVETFQTTVKEFIINE